MERLVMGVDGGQTSTKCVLATVEGRVLGYGRGGGLIHLAAEGGRQRFVSALHEAFASAWHEAQRSPQPLEAIGLGLTGVEAGSTEASVVRELLPQLVQARWVEVQTDGVAALIGAHADQPGIVVIAGTGAISLGKDVRGHLARVGGWGWLLGDEGSAFAIGRDGLKSALDAFDGIEPPTVLQALVLQHFQVPEIRAIKRLLYAPTFGAREFAVLAAVVSDAAVQGDAVAMAIVQRAGWSLARTVAALLGKLEFGAQLIPVAPSGGAFTHVAGLKTAFVQQVQALCASAVVVEPSLPPVVGALLVALKRCVINVEQVVAQLQGRAQSG